MSKTWTVFKYELINTLTRRSFILTLILVPLIPAIIVGILGQMNQGQREAVQQVFSPEAGSSLPDGYIDQSGLIQSLPEWLPQGSLLPYTDEAKAQSDLEASLLNAYYVVPEDYIEKGEVILVRKDANPVTGFDQTDTFEQVLRFNLLGADPERFMTYTNPVSYQYINLRPQEAERDQQGPLAFYLPYGITMLFYMLIMMTASFLLNNISKEKENRVMELLMSSVKPIELFTGKLIALGLAGLLQLVVWLGSALLILRLGGTTLNIPANLQLPPSLLLWGIVFFVLGYGLYGSLMAGVGAMVPNLREASQATMIVIIPMIIPLMFINILIQEPNGALATVISLIPLTAPVAMMTRLAAGSIPLWQVLLSTLLLLGTVILIIRSVAKLFRAQTLLAGQKFSNKAFLKALVSRAQ
jgi:ABC-2 type transport system permease protein